jgi:Fe-S cluster assembly protein SufB
MTEPTCFNVHYPPIDYRDHIIRRQEARRRPRLGRGRSQAFGIHDKLGIPLRGRGTAAGAALDAVFDSVSVGTTFRSARREGVIFCSSRVRSEASDLVRQPLGTVVLQTLLRGLEQRRL